MLEQRSLQRILGAPRAIPTRFQNCLAHQVRCSLRLTMAFTETQSKLIYYPFASSLRRLTGATSTLIARYSRQSHRLTRIFEPGVQPGLTRLYVEAGVLSIKVSQFVDRSLERYKRGADP